MTIAMCRGTAAVTLYRQDLLLFRVADLVRGEDVAVGQLLELRLEPLLVIRGDARALRLRPQLVRRVAAERAELDPPFLHLLVELLHEVLPPLLGERRDRQTDEGAVVARRKPEVAPDDRLLDRLDEALVPGLDDDEPRLRRADRCERDERGRRAVRLDLEALDERRRRAPGADGLSLVLERVDGLPHPR